MTIHYSLLTWHRPALDVPMCTQDKEISKNEQEAGDLEQDCDRRRLGSGGTGNAVAGSPTDARSHADGRYWRHVYYHSIEP